MAAGERDVAAGEGDVVMGATGIAATGLQVCRSGADLTPLGYGFDTVMVKM